MAGVIDAIYTFRFLKLLSIKWENTDAYKLGIIDKDGKPLKKSNQLTTTEERKSYTSFVRLVFKLKRLMGTIPGGKSAVARYGAALALLKENSKEVLQMGINLKVLEEGLEKYIDEEVANGVGGIEGKEQPLGKKGEMKRRKDKKGKDCPCKNKGGDEVSDKGKRDSNKHEDVKYSYQMIGEVLVRVDELKRVVKKRVNKNIRSKKREYVPTKRRTRTGGKKLRGGKKAKWKRSHKKAYRKAHTGSAAHKRKRSMRKSNKINKRGKK